MNRRRIGVWDATVLYVEDEESDAMFIAVAFKKKGAGGEVAGGEGRTGGDCREGNETGGNGEREDRKAARTPNANGGGSCKIASS